MSGITASVAVVHFSVRIAGSALAGGFIPVNLTGYKVRHAGFVKDLRHLAGESEYIGNHARSRYVLLAKLFFKEVLGIEALTDQGFTVGDIQVGLDHLAAGDIPLAVFDQFLEPFPIPLVFNGLSSL